MIHLGGLTTQAKALIYHFPNGAKQSPNWDGAGSGNYSLSEGANMPITDKSFWEGRYVYCELSMKTEEGLEMVFPLAVVSLQRSKQIISTQLVGGDGSIHEFISNGDYEINIYLELMSDGQDLYPEDKMRDFKALAESNKSITVYSKFFELFDIDRIIIKSYSLSQETHSNIQAVSLTAVSDNEYNVFTTDY